MPAGQGRLACLTCVQNLGSSPVSAPEPIDPPGINPTEQPATGQAIGEPLSIRDDDPPSEPDAGHVLSFAPDAPDPAPPPPPPPPPPPREVDHPPVTRRPIDLDFQQDDDGDDDVPFEFEERPTRKSHTTPPSRRAITDLADDAVPDEPAPNPFGAAPMPSPAASATGDAPYDPTAVNADLQSNAGKVGFCRRCGKKTQDNAVLCVDCGLLFKSGRRLKTKVLKADKEKKSKALDGFGPVIAGLITAATLIGLDLASSEDVRIAAAWLLLSGPLLIGYWAYSFVTAYMDGEGGWGTWILLYPVTSIAIGVFGVIIPFLFIVPIIFVVFVMPLTLIYYVVAVAWRPYYKAIGIAIIISMFASAFISFNDPDRQARVDEQLAAWGIIDGDPDELAFEDEFNAPSSRGFVPLADPEPTAATGDPDDPTDPALLPDGPGPRPWKPVRIDQ
ncbi:MAG: hypothetical protein AAFR38_08730 [Planctomycetota bacterium]